MASNTKGLMHQSVHQALAIAVGNDTEREGFSAGDLVTQRRSVHRDASVACDHVNKSDRNGLAINSIAGATKALQGPCDAGERGILIVTVRQPHVRHLKNAG